MAWFKKQPFTLLRAASERDRIPEGLCTKCGRCGAIVLSREWKKSMGVCLKCNFHSKISPTWRIEITLDPGSFVETDAEMTSGDPLNFVDSKPYPERIATYQKRAGARDAVMTGYGKIHGIDIALAFMRFSFIGGSMGSVVGEKITRTLERGLEKKMPVVIFCTSGGARMQEGILSLMQMAKTSSLVGKMRQAGLPYITILTDPTTAGVMASFASLGDLIIAEPQALVGFAGPRVIEQTIRQVLPKGFQRSEFVQEHGFIDMIVERRILRDTLGELLAMMTGRPSPIVESESNGSEQPPAMTG